MYYTVGMICPNSLRSASIPGSRGKSLVSTVIKTFLHSQMLLFQNDVAHHVVLSREVFLGQENNQEMMNPLYSTSLITMKRLP